MAEALFDAAAQKLEELTDFDRLVARGTLRIALKESGLDANAVTLQQLTVVFAKLMPEHLEKRAVADATGVCRAVIDGLSAADHAGAGSSTDEIFGRLGGD